MNFERLLSPEARARLEEYKRQLAETEAMTDAQLADRAIYTHRQMHSRWAPGDQVYDGVMYHVLVPEMIKRLRGKS